MLAHPCIRPFDRPRHHAAALALTCCGAVAHLLSGHPLAAQGAPGSAVPVQASLRGLPVRTVIWTNVGIGAGTAAVRAWRSGASAQRITTAALGGALGGAVMAGGFAVGGHDMPAARLLSVQTVATGASMARNAGRGAPLLSQVTLPLAPFVVSLGREDSTARAVRIRVSAASLSAIAMRLGSGQGMRVDWGQTAATGGVVFRTTHPAFDSGVQCPSGFECLRAGSQRWGVVAYRGNDAGAANIRSTLAHESMHVAQRARDLVLFGIPASDAMGRRSGSMGRRVSRFIVADAVMPLRGIDMLASHLAGSSYAGWYEREARTFAPGSAASFLRAGNP